MSVGLSIDFGTSNTRAAVWDESEGAARPLLIPDISMIALQESSDGAISEVPFIPSLICYDGRHTWIGKQVLDRGLSTSAATFRWMKRYIANRLDLPRKIGGRSVRYSEAGRDYLVHCIAHALAATGMEEVEAAFTLPVEAFEHYQEWLSQVCERAGLGRFRFIDEASAAAMGYGLSSQSGQVCMVFDFGGGTLDVSIVRMDEKRGGYRKCHVLGKGGADIGGATIDQWLYRDFLARNKKSAEQASHISASILNALQQAKESLTSLESVDIEIQDPETGEPLAARYSRSSLEDLMEERGMFETINRAMDRALFDAVERGYSADSIEHVLLVGGASLMPCVRRAVRQRFGARVRSHRPLDAVALGAAAFVGGVELYDHVQHEYALRYYNRPKGKHEFLTIVESGTPYPSKGPVRQVTICASYDGQEYLGLEVYEISPEDGVHTGSSAKFDLIFDPSGAVQFREREPHDEAARYFWINEKCPSFVHADPSALRGEKRFPVSFTIDAHKRLCVTVRDLRTGRMLMKDEPLIKLR
uniref:Hsp70 family protein n=1 Tax=Desulfomonile tiedjei TaxID=2358 RepID=A0A7C4ESG2_9BACT